MLVNPGVAARILLWLLAFVSLTRGAIALDTPDDEGATELSCFDRTLSAWSMLRRARSASQRNHQHRSRIAPTRLRLRLISRVRKRASSPLPKGKTDLKFNFTKTQNFGGIGELYVNGEKLTTLKCR